MMFRTFGIHDFLFPAAIAAMDAGPDRDRPDRRRHRRLCRGAGAHRPAARLRIAAATYIQVVQGIPVLMILFLSYYGLSLAGYRPAAAGRRRMSMSIYASGYLGEIWRGCIQAVPKPQWEAPRAWR